METQTELKTLKGLGEVANEINTNNGWEIMTPDVWIEDTDTKEIQQQKARFLCMHMALIHSEISEALEAIRHRDRDNFDEELADAIIRITSIAQGLGTDLDKAVHDKLVKNRSRGLYHGGKVV